MKIKSIYFYGNKVSDYGIEHGYVDYATLAKAFDAVLNNEIMGKTYEIGYWEQVSGMVDNNDKIEEIREQIEELEDAITEDSTEEQDEEISDKIKELEEQIEELEEEQDNIPDIYQWYIVSDYGAEILQEAGEIVYYNEELDMYLWGVTHWGTSWDYVLTNIPIESDEEGEE